MSDTINSVFSISEDELIHRMNIHEEVKIDPGKKAVAVLEAAIDKVLSGLGVNIADVESIPDQMDSLGILMTENTDEKTPQLNGFFIFIQKAGDIIPHSWIGSARIDHDGKCYCDIQYFIDNRLDEFGGVKVIKG